MKYGRRSFGGASLTLRVPTALPTRMRGHVVELHDLYTSPECRGNGDAGMLMLQTTTEADVGGFFLFMSVLPGDQTDLDRLVAFYARNGFTPIQAEPLLMIRPCVSARARMAA